MIEQYISFRHDKNKFELQIQNDGKVTAVALGIMGGFLDCHKKISNIYSG